MFPVKNDLPWRRHHQTICHADQCSAAYAHAREVLVGRMSLVDKTTVQVAVALSLGMGCGVVIGLLIASRRRRLPLQLSANVARQARLYIRLL